MGLMKAPSCSTYERPQTAPTPPNPNPRDFVLVSWEHIGKHLVVEIRYPGCTTYEGRKLLVFANMDISTLARSSTIDPHFSDAIGVPVPVARFEPTPRGKRLARITAAAL